MKHFIKVLSLIGFASTIALSSASGQALALIFNLDEFGNSFGLGISPGFVSAADPSGGSSGPVLIYNLAFPILTGDVVLSEPGAPTGQFSDVVRFWNPNGLNSGQIIFYSDFSIPGDPTDAPADTGLPQGLINPTFVTEIGPEGNNGVTWNPLPGQGGFIPGLGAQYQIISDGQVPEPGAGSLMTLGGGLILLLKRRVQANRG